jgi:hypothetical protein
MTDKVYCLMNTNTGGSGMGSTTFGYDPGEDRVWLSFNDDTPRLWFTRRLVSHLLGPMLHAFEQAAPGSQGGADASTRAGLEHDIALNEWLPGDRAVPLKVGSETASASRDADYLVCTGLKASFDAGQCQLRFDTSEAERSLTMGRVAMHRWVHGLHLVARHANWALTVPEWLSRSCLPEAVRALVQDAHANPPPEPGTST